MKRKHDDATADGGASIAGIRVLGDVTSLKSKGSSLEAVLGEIAQTCVLYLPRWFFGFCPLAPSFSLSQALFPSSFLRFPFSSLLSLPSLSFRLILQASYLTLLMYMYANLFSAPPPCSLALSLARSLASSLFLSSL